MPPQTPTPPPLTTLKATLGPTTRRLPLPTPLTLSTLHATLTHHFHLSTPHLLTYLDSDHDIITISSDTELHHHLATLSDPVLRLVLHPPHHLPTALHHHHRRLRPHSTLPPEQSRAVDALVAALVDLISTLGHTASSGACNPTNTTAVSVAEEGVMMGGVADGNVLDEEQVVRRGGEHYAVRSESSMVDTDTSYMRWGGGEAGAEAPWLDVLLSAGRPPWRAASCRVGPEVRAAFFAVLHYLYKSPERGRLSRRIRDSLPVMRRWGVGSLGEEGVPGESCVGKLVEGVREFWHGGDVEFGRLLERFLRCALRDPVVLGILRRLRKVLPMEGGGEGDKKECRRWKAFDVHFGTVCVSCDVKPIVGSRFMDVRRENFNLCAKCYYSSDVAQQDMQFRECRYVWESVLPPGCSVPPPGLSVGDRGPMVKFLNKLLIDVGAMTEGLYPGKIGFFGENTRAAVRRFQQAYRLEGECEDGVYDEVTAERLADVVEGASAESGGNQGEEEPGGQGLAMSD